TRIARSRNTPRRSALTDRRALPFGNGMTLPRLFAGRLFCFVEVEKPSLCAGVELHLQSVIVLPRYVEASGLAHNAANPECLALEACLIIFREIPGVSNANAFWVERYAFEIASARCHHPMAPVFADNRNPVPCEINRGDGLCRLCRTTLSPTLAIRENTKGH